MPRLTKRGAPATRLTLEQIVEDEGGPWYEGRDGYEDLDPVVGLFLVGPGLDLGERELAVMAGAWEDLRFAVRRARRQRGCPHLDRPGGTPYHDVAKGQCPSWWEEQAQRVRRTAR